MNAVKELLPQLHTMPSDAGMVAYLDLSQPLNDTQAAALAKELNVCESRSITLQLSLTMISQDDQTFNFKVNASFLKRSHATLRRVIGDQQLAPNCLRFFLECVCDQLPNPNTLQPIEDAVRFSLHLCSIHARCTYVPMAPPASKSDTHVDALARLVAVARNALRGMHDGLTEQAKQLRAQHGGLDAHQTIDQLMAKMKSTVDLAATERLQEQVMGIHAHQLAASSAQLGEWCGELAKHFTAALNGLQLEE